MERLSAVVSSIQQDVAVVPKGAYIQTETGAVVPNNSFQGLSPAEACRLNYYLHFYPRTVAEETTSIVCTIAYIFIIVIIIVLPF